MKNWSDFDKFDVVVNRYMPDYGEGDTMASQMATAVNKLIYKWYNDGDVYDNTYSLEGWTNDLSSYANWIASHDFSAYRILSNICDCNDGNDYEDLLWNLANITLDETFLEDLAKKEKQGTIYNCDGRFCYVEAY